MDAQPMRVAIVSTPRAGNTWLLHLLARLYKAKSLPVYNPGEVDWPNLPANVILQVHWHADGSFQGKLLEHGFRVVAIARHPLDVLISVLHFALHEPTARWLEGEDGNERSIFGAMPRSAAFLNYATGPRARALLSVTPEWWREPGCVAVRYEDLLADTPGHLGRVVDGLGLAPLVPVTAAIEATSIPKLRKHTNNNHHFWQGKAGLWKLLFTAREAAVLHEAYADMFAALGYVCDPDPELTPAAADDNWIKLVWAGLADDLHALRQRHKAFVDVEHLLHATYAELEKTRVELSACRAALDEANRRCEENESWRRAHEELRLQYEDVWARLVPLEQLGPQALGIARRVRTLAHRHPGASELVKKLMRLAG